MGMEKNLENAFIKYCSFDNNDFMKSSDFRGFIAALSFFVEQICNADAANLKEFLLEETKKDIFMLPPWIRLIIIQNIMFKTPNDKEFFEWASGNLSLFYHPESPIILELDEKAKP